MCHVRTQAGLKHGTFMFSGFMWLFYQYLWLLCNKTSIISQYFVTSKPCCFAFDSVFQSDREPPPVMHCVAYFNFENICKDLGKVQLPWCIKENSATTIWELGRITVSSYTISQIWQFQNPALDHLNASSCFSPFQ